MTPYYDHAGVTLYHGDALAVLATLPEASVQCVISSPPYYGLRDYGTGRWEGGDSECDHKRPVQPRNERPAGAFHGGTDEGNYAREPQYRDTCGKCGARRVDDQIGLEDTPTAYLARLVEVFRAVRRVLRPDGTCWVNLGDSYAGGHSGRKDDGRPEKDRGWSTYDMGAIRERPLVGYKPKDLMMMPARLAIALCDDGWYLRSDIIWSKPNPMPESVTDRPTTAHEHVFLLARSATYYYDQGAGREEAVNGERFHGGYGKEGVLTKATRARNGRMTGLDNSTTSRNARTVWTIATQPYPEAHFATFPEALVERCLLAGSRPGDVVLDPFVGSGTVAWVAKRLNRAAIGIDLNAAYLDLAARRLAQDTLWGVRVAEGAPI